MVTHKYHNNHATQNFINAIFVRQKKKMRIIVINNDEEIWRMRWNLWRMEATWESRESDEKWRVLSGITHNGFCSREIAVSILTLFLFGRWSSGLSTIELKQGTFLLRRIYSFLNWDIIIFSLIWLDAIM